MATEAVIGLVGGIIGAVGGVVGILTSLRSHRRDSRKDVEEQENFDFLARLMAKQIEVKWAGHIVFEIEIGSKDWQRAEKMVEAGTLARGPQGQGYRLRGFEELKPRQPKRLEKKAPLIEVDRNPAPS